MTLRFRAKTFKMIFDSPSSRKGVDGNRTRVWTRLKPMSHYFFREKIALAWLDEEQYWPRRYSRRPKSNNKPDSKSKKVHVSSSASSARMTCSVVVIEDGNYKIRIQIYKIEIKYYIEYNKGLNMLHL